MADYAYLTETSTGKYQTNTIVWDLNSEQLEAQHQAYRRFAERVADHHYEAISDNRTDLLSSGIYIPDNDFNFLLWTLLPRDLERQADIAARGIPEPPAAVPIRKDGGQYIALTSVDRGPIQLSFDERDYVFSGPMTRATHDSPLYLWMANHCWSEWRHWADVNYRDVALCHAYRTGTLQDVEEHREDYAYLLERGYLLRRSDGHYALNALWVDSPEVEDRVHEAIPELHELYKHAVAELYEELLELHIRNQPDIIHPQIKFMVKGYATGGPVTAYVLKHLVDAGKLREPLPHQRKTLSTWMGAIRR